MTTKEAISFLSSIGWKVDTIKRGKYRIWEKGGEVFTPFGFERQNTNNEFWNARQIIKFARYIKMNESLDKKVKRYDDTKNRRATRDALKTENFDKIPRIKGKVKSRRDPWIYRD